MSGFQFVHLETYARKADAKGRSVSYVLDEAAREPGAAPHVAAPRPPEVVDGMDLATLRALHDERAAAATTTNAAGRTSRIRSDQHTLATVVASHPGGPPEAVAEWERRTVAWLRESYGDALASVVRHVDEGRPHLHAYLLPGDDMRARLFHPGVSAKAEAKAAALAEGMPAKEANARGDAAYKAAMRGWQDSYWQAVGLPCGLARLGPGRRRLSREAWRIEQAQAVRAALVDRRLSVVDKAEATITAKREELAALKAERDAVLRSVEEAKRQADLAERKGAALIDAARKKAARIVDKARAEASALRGMAAAVGAAVGGALGAAWQGLLASSPERVAAAVREEMSTEHAREVGGLCRELSKARQEAQEARQDAQGWRGAAGRLREDLEAARAALEALRAPKREQDLAKRQGPR